jgi:hypothetical protein
VPFKPTIVLGLLAAWTFVSPAQAINARVNELLNKLEMATQSLPPAAIVNRSFTVEHNITFTLPDGPNCPCFAQSTIFQFGSNSVQNSKTVKLTRAGNVCTGKIRHRVRWTKADDALNVNASVSAFTKCPEALDPVNVNVGETLAPFPLPAQGSTKSVTHTLQD